MTCILTLWPINVFNASQIYFLSPLEVCQFCQCFDALPVVFRCTMTEDLGLCFPLRGTFNVIPNSSELLSLSTKRFMKSKHGPNQVRLDGTALFIPRRDLHFCTFCSFLSHLCVIDSVPVVQAALEVYCGFISASFLGAFKVKTCCKWTARSCPQTLVGALWLQLCPARWISISVVGITFTTQAKPSLTDTLLRNSATCAPSVELVVYLRYGPFLWYLIFLLTHHGMTEGCIILTYLYSVYAFSGDSMITNRLPLSGVFRREYFNILCQLWPS